MLLCHICGQRLASRTSLWRHIKLQHEDDESSSVDKVDRIQRWINGVNNDLEIQSHLDNEGNNDENEETDSGETGDEEFIESNGDEKSETSDKKDEDVFSSGEDDVDVFSSADGTSTESEMDDDDSEMGAKHDIDDEKDAYEGDDETSDTDYEEQMNMRIEWPSTDYHKLLLPWKSTSDPKRIETHRNWLRHLSRIEDVTLIRNIRKASKFQFLTLCEICLNILEANVPLDDSDYKSLKKQRNGIRKLADPNLDWLEKREYVLKKGADFVSKIIGAVEPILRD